MNDLIAQVRRGLSTRSETYLRNVFNNYMEKSTGKIQPSKLSAALMETRICDLDECDQGGGGKQVDFDSFKNLANKSSDLDQWAQSIPLWQLLSDCLPRRKGVRFFVIQIFA